MVNDLMVMFNLDRLNTCVDSTFIVYCNFIRNQFFEDKSDSARAFICRGTREGLDPRIMTGFC